MRVLLREVSPRLKHCELTHLPRTPIDLSLARQQHVAYANLFRELGAQVEYLPALPNAADGVFVEDTAVFLPEVAILARPGAASRLAEIESVASTLAQYSRVTRIDAPGTIDGGDVLRIGRTLYVTESARTNAEGIAQLSAVARAEGYVVQTVRVRGCLHLKTAVTYVPPNLLVVNSAWIDPAPFDHQQLILVDESEPFAANTLTLGGVTLVSASHPRTAERLRTAGIVIRTVAISEFEKAEGGVTCLSLVME